ncbi:hypothetical protein ACFPYJ_25515 [Paenibacillus solisilvae]|uniref:Calx-beta domain-containing protein n=1 Tax=Paenibacillus solisilvae TaxID=2486751 RepID=A0ABW0W4P5_9BACL
MIFADGEKKKTIEIPILNDTLREYNESFEVHLSAIYPLNGRVSTKVVIYDKDHLK